MKQYTKDMKAEEVIERLQKGEVLRCDGENCEVSWINGVICKLYNGFEVINASFTNSDVTHGYFEIEEPIEIKETGLYRTRNGTKVFVSIIEEGLTYPIIGLVEGSQESETWMIDGSIDKDLPNNKLDIVAKWSE